jgi:hypothetical protein
MLRHWCNVVPINVFAKRATEPALIRSLEPQLRPLAGKYCRTAYSHTSGKLDPKA